MRFKKAAIVLLALLSLPVCLRGADRPPEDGRQRGDEQRGGGRGDRWRTEEVSDELRSRVEEFWKTNAPNRWEAYVSIKDEKKKKEIFGFMVGYYRGLGWLRHDEELFDARKKQIRIEDAIFAAQKQYKEAGGEDSADPRAEQARLDLERLAGELVQARIEEKKLRIERLDQQVKKEQRELEEEVANSAKMAEEMYNRLLRGDPPVGRPPRGLDRRGDRSDRGGREKHDKRDNE